MATQKERELTFEILRLAIEVNESGRADVHVEYSGDSVHIYIVPMPYKANNEWLYYANDHAYFSGKAFKESEFIRVANEYIAEIKKHHPAYDSDGVKL
jgi:hypothetical protein